MKRITGKLLTLVLAMAMVFAAFTSPADAKSDKSEKAGKKTSAVSPMVAHVTIPAVVTLEDAREIALNQAGVNGEDAVFSREKLDKGVYELKFSDENGKYEYEISAVDGTILDEKRDVRTAAVSGDSFSLEGAVSWEEARQAALDAAGVDEEALKYLTCYVSWTNHVPTAYEVKFATRWADYRYTVDLDTGAVVGGVCHSHRR